METQTLAGVVGAVALALAGWLGKSAATMLRERGRLREITRAGDTEIAKAREARPWTLMEQRIDDLEAALERVSKSDNQKQELVERLRDERDRLRIEVTDLQIEVRKANALRHECTEERKQHAATVARLSAEIRRLRGER